MTGTNVHAASTRSRHVGCFVAVLLHDSLLRSRHRNCHFTLAVIIGLGMYGMREQLELEWPPATGQSEQLLNSMDRVFAASLTGITDTQSQRLPKDLKEATDQMMRPSSLARQVLGNDFVDHL